MSRNVQFFGPQLLLCLQWRDGLTWNKENVSDEVCNWSLLMCSVRQMLQEVSVHLLDDSEVKRSQRKKHKHQRDNELKMGDASNPILLPSTSGLSL